MMNWICNTAVTGKEALRRLQLLLNSTNKTTWWWRWVPEVQLGEIKTARSTIVSVIILKITCMYFLITNHPEQVRYGQSTRPLFSRTGVARARHPMCMWSKGYEVIAHGLYILCSSQLFLESLTFSVLFGHRESQCSSV